MSKSIDISSKSYSSGDVIVKCYPLVHTVKYEFRGQCCDYCLKFCSQLKRCAKCLKLNYCNTECQRKDWIYHKHECQVLSKYKLLSFEKQGFDYMQRLVLRLYLMAVHKPQIMKRKYHLHNGLHRTLEEMESHSEDITNTKAFEGIVNYFKLYSIEDYDRDLVLKLYGILQINAFGIDSYDEERGISHCASGLYIEGSVFDHCCQPNACASGEGLLLEIRALREISVGEEITIDYVQNVLPKIQRQTSLKEKYFFICRCFRCESDFDQNFDYKKFEELENKNTNFVNKRKGYENFKARHQLMRKYYPYFHPNYSYFLYEYLKYILSVESIHKNSNIAKQLKENVKITHGIDHNFSKIISNIIANNC